MEYRHSEIGEKASKNWRDHSLGAVIVRRNSFLLIDYDAGDEPARVLRPRSE